MGYISHKLRISTGRFRVKIAQNVPLIKQKYFDRKFQNMVKEAWKCLQVQTAQK